MSLPASSSVQFLPLGGLGEIGMNCFALIQDGAILVVDVGAAFPDDDLGVDVIHPDFTWLVERAEKICGIFVTHGHEDHIGAIPYLLRALEKVLPALPPVFAPLHACALMAHRLLDHEMSTECLCTVEPGLKYDVGPFVVEPVRVAHSIIDATALSISTAAGQIFHTADFDLDEEQPAGHLTDVRRLSELGEEGVRLLLSDSTNIDTQNRGASEGDVGRALREIVLAADQRVVVALFSSNIHRILALSEAASASGRKLCFLGRSLNKHVEIARRMGRLKFKSDALVSSEQVSALPRDKVLILASGTQGEGPSSLKRLSLGNHPDLALESGDWVLLSSRVIPGNEKSVFTMQNDLTRRGVVVKTRLTDPGIHVSGHASRTELGRMIELLSPQGFIPVHGTLHHLTRHEELAREMGVEDTLVVENGSLVEVSIDLPLQKVGEARSGKVRVALGGEVLTPAARRKRGDLGRSGVVFVSVILDSQEASLCTPSISSSGVPGVDGDERAFSVLESIVRSTLIAAKGARMVRLEERLKAEVRRAVSEMSGARPVVEVHVLRT